MKSKDEGGSKVKFALSHEFEVEWSDVSTRMYLFLHDTFFLFALNFVFLFILLLFIILNILYQRRMIPVNEWSSRINNRTWSVVVLHFFASCSQLLSDLLCGAKFVFFFSYMYIQYIRHYELSKVDRSIFCFRYVENRVDHSRWALACSVAPRPSTVRSWVHWDCYLYVCGNCEFFKSGQEWRVEAARI